MSGLTIPRRDLALLAMLLFVAISARGALAEVIECDAAGRLISRQSPTPASNEVAPGDLYVEPSTLHSLGFQWRIQGDENRNARVQISYRKADDQDWRQGMDLLRMKGELVDPGEGQFTCPNLFAGSLLFLTPATHYVVRLQLIDPDGGSYEETLHVPTKTEPAPARDGRLWHVYPESFRGQRKSPAFTTMADAYDKAAPGDQIVLHEGEYRLPPLNLNKQNTRERPIVIRSAGDGDATLISTPADGQKDVVFEASGGSYHWIQGLSLRGGYAGIHGGEQRAVTGLTVRDCEFVDCGWAGILLAGGHNRDLYLADNVFRPSQFTWQVWKKGVTPQFPYKGVWIGGQGVDVCHNRVVGSKDGISVHQPSSRPQLAGFDRKLAAIDFYNNDVRQMSDDNEADGGQHNIRFFCNRFVDQYVGFSAQPVYGGPCYFVRNVMHNIVRGTALKLNLQPSGVVVLNNTFIGGTSANRSWTNCHIHNNLFLAASEEQATFEAGPLDPGVSRFSHNGFLPVGPVNWLVPNPKVPGRMRQDKRVQTLADLDRLGAASDSVAVSYNDFVALKRPGGIANPNLDGEIGDARLKPGSAAVDAGMKIPTVTDGFTGQAPDLGAYELHATPPTYGPRPNARWSNDP